MKKVGLAALFGTCLLLAPVKAKAEAKILSFQLGGIVALPDVGTNSVMAQAAWTPIFGLGPLGLRGELGATLLDTGAGSFVALNYEALLRMGLFPNVTLEAGGGLQTWAGNGGTSGVISAGLAFGLAGTLDRIYATYSRFLLGGGANMLKFGVGLSF
jgi:hypothetical protein